MPSAGHSQGGVGAPACGSAYRPAGARNLSSKRHALFFAAPVGLPPFQSVRLQDSQLLLSCIVQPIHSRHSTFEQLTARQCQMAESARLLTVSVDSRAEQSRAEHSRTKHSKSMARHWCVAARPEWLTHGLSPFLCWLELRHPVCRSPPACRSPQDTRPAVSLKHSSWDHPVHRKRAESHPAVLEGHTAKYITHRLWLCHLLLQSQCAAP